MKNSLPIGANSRDKVDAGRRGFLTAAGLAGAGTAVAAVSLGTADAQESPEEQVQARYQATPHVERFYFLNRL